MNKVYFDHIAGAPIYGEVKEAMMPYFETIYANPQSIHAPGEEAKSAIDESREKTASLIGAETDEIYFTSSGTEGNNIAVKGIAKSYRKKGKHIVISPIEHYSVLHSVKSLEKEGYDVTELKVDSEGFVDLEYLQNILRDDTILVSIQTASSEIGTIQRMEKIAEIVKEKDIILHTDAVAACGRIKLDVKKVPADLMTIAAQNFYGPKGAAALYIRKGIKTAPLIEGGIQEKGVRPGSENLPAIVGMGVAAELTLKEMEEQTVSLNSMEKKLIESVPDSIERVFVTGPKDENRLPGHASFCIEFIEGEGMLLFLNMDGIFVSSGSACTSKALKASHVLLACGIDHALAQGSLVLSLGKDNTDDDVQYFIDSFPPIVERLRQMSPLYGDYLKNKNS